MQIYPLIDPYALRQDGSKPLTANWDAGAYKITTAYINITDETNGYQIDGIRVLSIKGSGGNENVFLGQAGNFTATGTENVGIGSYALQFLTSGSSNAAWGRDALNELTEGDCNVALGHSAGYTITTGSHNTAVGYGSCSTENGDKNTAIGGYSLAGTPGSGNVGIGYFAGDLSTGSQNVFLGYYAGCRQTTNSNLLIIDNQDRVSAANELTKALIYGVFDADPANQTLRFNAVVDMDSGSTIGTLTLADGSITDSGGTISMSGYLGLGSGVGALLTPIYIDYDLSAGNLNGLTLNLTNTWPSSGGNIRGLYFVSEWKPPDELTANRVFQGLYGIFGLTNLSSANLTSGYNIQVNTVAGAYYQVQATKGGSHTGTCTVVDGRGLWIADAGLSGGATITTLYGLYIENIDSGTTNYAIYSAGGQSVHAGKFRIGDTTAPTEVFEIKSDSVRIVDTQSPASDGTGTQGEIAWDADYVYICTATNTWKRAALTGGY